MRSGAYAGRNPASRRAWLYLAMLNNNAAAMIMPPPVRCSSSAFLSGRCSPDVLDAIASHLPPAAFVALLRTCRKLYEWGRCAALPHVKAVELRRAQRLDCGDLRAAVRRFPRVAVAQVDCFCLGDTAVRDMLVAEHGQSAWRLAELRLMYIEQHTDSLLAPLAAASGPLAVGEQLLVLTLSIGADATRCCITESGVAAAVAGCPNLRRLGLDLGRHLRPEEVTKSLLPCMAQDTKAHLHFSGLLDLSLCGHNLREATYQLFHQEENAPQAPCFMHSLRVAQLHEREEFTVGGAILGILDLGEGVRLLVDALPVMTELRVKAPVVASTDDIGPLSSALISDSRAGRRPQLVRLALSNTTRYIRPGVERPMVSRWADDMAFMMLAHDHPNLQVRRQHGDPCCLDDACM